MYSLPACLAPLASHRGLTPENRPLVCAGNSRYEIWKMVPPGKVEYYFSYKAPTVEGTTANPNAMTQKSADNLMSVRAHANCPGDIQRGGLEDMQPETELEQRHRE